ncbi:MAG: ABC transporter ATP-binding protein [Rhodospirillaceae bacterium]|nr:ABC transporter ATP-binding protein [Rhodospirillaceae bacterium]
MLRIESLSAGYGDVRVLRDVRLDVALRETVTLLGANGAGKTTLLRAAMGLVPSSAGLVEFQGESLAGLRANQIVERGLVLVPEGRALFPFMTVLENLELGSYSQRARPRRRGSLDRVFDMLPRLRERRSQLAGSLSGGEQQMCAIGRGLMALPDLLLLDEPSLGLAPVVVHEIFNLIGRLAADGIAVLLVEQHVKRALAVADRGYVLENGSIATTGSGAALLSDPALRKAYMGQKH